MPAVAAALGMASRSLHRHLAAEGTTFRLLIDEVRSALAEEMLSHRMSVAEVAERLGYAKAASFSHAFKRRRGPRKCTGPAPEAWCQRAAVFTARVSDSPRARRAQRTSSSWGGRSCERR